MTLLADFARVTKSRHCPICDHADWCLVDRRNPPARAICARIESPRPWGDAGWLHVLRRDAGDLRNVRRVRTVVPPPVLVTNFTPLAEQFTRQMVTSHLDTLAKSLGVTPGSLRRLGIGWTRRAWSFPMKDAAGAIVGVRLRFPDGSKLSIKGGKEGLFTPSGLDTSGRLLIAEGPTDTGALLDLGFNAIGRPSCTGGTRQLVSYVRNASPTSIIIVSDSDERGMRGAASLASVLAVYSKNVQVIRPPTPIKDARAWVQLGATSADIEAAIATAPVVVIPVRTRRSGS